MAAKKKRGGRVTPKGTQPPKKRRVERVDESDEAEASDDDQPTPDPFAGHQPKQVHKEQGRGARPISHNRGNR